LEDCKTTFGQTTRNKRESNQERLIVCVVEAVRVIVDTHFLVD
jgi:hypothetical protein